VSAGYDHTLAKTTSGEVWAWGDNDYGQLGDDTAEQHNIPVQVSSSATNYVVLSAGRYFSIATNTLGELWSWGRNAYGALGNGERYEILVPTQEESNSSKWIDIGAGESFTVALDENGTLWSWGKNLNYELGDNTNVSKFHKVEVPSARTWTSMSVGYRHTMAIDNEKKLWGMGVNSNGEIGNGGTGVAKILVQINGDTDWTFVSAGYSHTLAIKDNGELWAWGQNTYGQLGNNTTDDKTTPIKVNSSDSIWAYASAGAGAFGYSMAIKTDGTLWAWGNNGYGQLGNNTKVDSNVSIQIGSDSNWLNVSAGMNHTVAVKTDGTLWTWGSNTSGKLGNDNTNTESLVPQKVGSASNWTYARAGTGYTVAINSAGELWSWGDNYSGQLGVGTTITTGLPARVGTATNWIKIDACERHTVALNDDNSDAQGEVWVWGKNEFGQVAPVFSKPALAQTGE